MFRVFDNERQEWVTEDVYLTTDDDLVMIKQVLGLVKSFTILDQDRYICHRSIDLQDVNNKEVFEGDFIKARVDEDKEVIGVVCYAHELSAYIILVEETSEFYTLGFEVAEFISVIGNVFDGYENEKYGEQALSE